LSCSFAWHSSPHYCTLWFSYCVSMYLVSVYHVSMYSVPLASEMIGFSSTNWFPFASEFLYIFSIQYDEHVYRLLQLSNGRKIYGRLSNAWKLGKMCDLVNFRSIILVFSSIYSSRGFFMLKFTLILWYKGQLTIFLSKYLHNYSWGISECDWLNQFG